MATESKHIPTLIPVKTLVSKRLQVITNVCSLCRAQSLQAHSQQLMQQMANPVKLTEALLALTSILTTNFFSTTTFSWLDFEIRVSVQ